MTPTSISVVVPAYNVEGFIEDTLASVLLQVPPVHELIIVDDGSTDSTAARLSHFAGDPLVKTFRTFNRGGGAARNQGLQMATGEYVYFLDGDDLLNPRFTQVVSDNIVAASRPDLVLFSGESFSDRGRSDTLLPDYTRKIQGLFPNTRTILRALMETNSFKPNPWLYVSRRMLWQERGLAFGSVWYCDDETAIFPLLASATRALILTDVLVRHRIRDGSVMTSKEGARNAAGYLATLNGLMAFYRSERALVGRDDDLWKARIGEFALAYSAACKRLHLSVEYAALMDALRIIGWPSPVGRIALSRLPLGAQHVAKMVFRLLRG